MPSSWSIAGGAWETLLTYLSFEIPPRGDPYNPIQQLAYFGIVFLLSPLTIATGAAMSPAVAGRFPSYVRLFGGRQVARFLRQCGGDGRERFRSSRRAGCVDAPFRSICVNAS